MKIIKKRRKYTNIIFTIFVSLFFCKSIAQDTITIKNYKNDIINQYNLFQETEERKYLDKVLRFVKLNELVIKEDSINSKIYYLKGVNSFYLKRYDRAEGFFLKSYALANKTNDSLLMGTVCNARGVNYAHGKGDHELAAKLYEEAIKYYKNINEKLQLIDGYFNLMINSRRREKWELSIKYANECLASIDGNNKRKWYIKRIYYFIADSYIELNEYQKALVNLKLSQKYTLPKDNYENLLLMKGYAKYYEAIGEYSDAISSLKEVISYQKKFKKENDNLLKNAFVKELEIENKLKSNKNVIISSQKKMLFLSVSSVLLLITLLIVLILFIKKVKKKNSQIKSLNNELKKLVLDLKKINADLHDKKTEIESLLKLNEQSLFSRVLKISTYNDTIRKISEDINNYTNNNPISSGYLFSLNNKLLALISEEELWKDFKIQFEKIRPNFFSKLRSLAPGLSVNDLKHCTYIVSNLKSKEVAQLINVTPRSVETTRYRIKKKIGLDKEENLYDLLVSL